MLIYISFDNTTIALNSNIPSSERHIFQFLIETTNHTIEAISKAVRYENPLSFSRAYKRVFGHSPRNSKT